MSIEEQFEDSDFTFMARAIQLARKGLYTTHPNPRVGCVIVKDNDIIGEGYHKKSGQHHAEIDALRSMQNGDAKGATAYVTLEPCSHTGKTPPCANALIDAQISRVVIAMQDPNPEVSGQGIQRLRDAGINVQVGILEKQARLLNLGFIKRMEQGLPWVRIKLAMSLDGRTAMASGESQWITGSDARQDVQQLRAMADAILTGSGTVLEDDPSLNVRITPNELKLDKGLKYEQPLRVVLDSALRINTEAKILSPEGNVRVYTCVDDKQKLLALQEAGADVVVMKCINNKLPLKKVLQDLSNQQINEVHVEAGATLCGAFLQENLIDEVIIYMAPTIMGSNARGLFNLPELEEMKDKIGLKIQDISAVGDDWRISISPINN